jgi:site-specific DNA-methyltransferase (adenine-specific)
MFLCLFLLCACLSRDFYIFRKHLTESEGSVVYSVSWCTRGHFFSHDQGFPSLSGMAMVWTNQLYFGDNLAILRKYVPEASVDLIYLDPPFNSNATYNVLFAERSGEKSAAQIAVFEDTWHWGEESEHAFWDIVSQGPAKSAKLLSALRECLGNNDLMAYLTMMAIRLIEMHHILKPTGSIYLHCDPTASHYLKMLLDAIFRACRVTKIGGIGQRFPPKEHQVLFLG